MTTVVAMKSALVDRLAPLTGVQVTYGDDVRSPRKERIYMGDVDEHEVAPATMRSSKVRTEENYTLQVMISVDSRKGQPATETRALALLGQLELLLATDPKLSAATAPPGILFATFAGFSMSTSIVSEGEHRSLVKADITVKARNS